MLSLQNSVEKHVIPSSGRNLLTTVGHAGAAATPFQAVDDAAASRTGGVSVQLGASSH